MPLGVSAGKTYGPYSAELVSVYDGDTIKVDVHVWPGQINRVSVRLNGIDTPEIRGKCVIERELAQDAKEFVINALEYQSVVIDHVKLGKYAGRVVANVKANDRDLTEMLIEAGLGRSYDGGKRKGWCL